MPSEAPFELWGGGAAGIGGAGRLAAHAYDLIRAAAPREWRSIAALAFTERLDALGRDCAALMDDVAEAAHHVRALEVELAAGRDAVCLARPWWAGP